MLELREFPAWAFTVSMIGEIGANRPAFSVFSIPLKLDDVHAATIALTPQRAEIRGNVGVKGRER